MNILITGGHGFVARSITEELKTKYNIFAPGHKELDLLNLQDLQNFITKHKIDIIIHTAICLGREFKLCTIEDAYKNILMSENLIIASKNCKYLINMASGGEFSIQNNIYDSYIEEEIFNIVPTEYGAFSKSIIAKRILSLKQPVGINLRFLGCFGYYEKNDRFIKKSLINIINQQPIIIYQNRWMDFIYVKDLIKVIEFILSNDTTSLDINCVYMTKYTLLDIARMIKTITQSDIEILINKEGLYNNYLANGNKLNSLNLSLIGLENGIKEVYEKLKEEL